MTPATPGKLEILPPGVTLEEVRKETGFELHMQEQARLLREQMDPEGMYLTPPEPAGRKAG